MHKVAFELGPITVHWYGVLVAAGFLTGIWTASRRGMREGITPETIMDLGKPTICAANGHVLAGALGLALACDLIVAKESAGFGTPEINVGLWPYMITVPLLRSMPPALMRASMRWSGLILACAR